MGHSAQRLEGKDEENTHILRKQNTRERYRQERKVSNEPGTKVFSCKARPRKLRQGNLGFKANLGYSEFQGSLGYKVKALSEVNSGGENNQM